MSNARECNSRRANVCEHPLKALELGVLLIRAPHLLCQGLHVARRDAAIDVALLKMERRVSAVMKRTSPTYEDVSWPSFGYTVALGPWRPYT